MVRLLSPSLTRAALQIAVVALFFYAGVAWSNELRLRCGPLKNELSNLYLGGFAYVSSSTANNGLIVQLFIKNKTGEWVLLGIDDKLNACQLMTGYGFQFVLGNDI